MVIGTGSKPAEETVEIKRILEPIQLHDGVISHAAARKLENRKFTFEEKLATLRAGGDEEVKEDELIAFAIRSVRERTGGRDRKAFS